MQLLTPLEAGTTQGWPGRFMTCYQKNCHLVIIWCLIRHSHRVLVGALEKYAPHSQRVPHCQMIQMNLLTSSPSTASFSRSGNLLNGECVPYKVHLAAFVSHSPLKMYPSDRIFWRSAFGFITSGYGVLVSTKSTMFTSQYGHLWRRHGCGLSSSG